MTPNSDILKQAEQNVIKIARAFQDAIKVLNATTRFSSVYCHEHVARKDFETAIYNAQNALLREFEYAISNCFLFVGVGGKESIEFSRELFEKVFSEENRACVMQFLNDHGQYPSFYKQSDDDSLREAAKQKLNSNNSD
jgi:hypothetical protein